MAEATGRTVITFDGDVQVVFPNALPVPQSHAPAAEPKLAYTIDEAAAVTSISRRKLQEYIQTGQLVTRRNGNSHLVRRADLVAFIDALPAQIERGS